MLVISGGTTYKVTYKAYRQILVRKVAGQPYDVPGEFGGKEIGNDTIDLDALSQPDAIVRLTQAMEPKVRGPRKKKGESTE